MRREQDLVHAVINYLNSKGHYVWRNNTGAIVSVYNGIKRFIRYGKKGSSDVIGVAKDGRMMAIECKIEGHKTDKLRFEDQLRFLDVVRRRGGIAILAYKIDDVMGVL